MTGSHDDTSDPAELSASAAKWRERAQAVDLTGLRRAGTHAANPAASLAGAETGLREDPHVTCYTVHEVAERLNVCAKTIRNWARDGRLPTHRLGKKLAISKNDLTDFIANRRTLPRKLENSS